MGKTPNPTQKTPKKQNQKTEKPKQTNQNKIQNQSKQLIK